MNDTIPLSNALNSLSHELYNITVQYGSACLLGDKDRASRYWSQLLEGYQNLGQLVALVHKLESKEQDTADILAEIGEV